MALIYIASPYTLGDQALNVRRQIEAADKLLELGHIPLIPCLSHLWHLISPKPYDEWLRIGIAWLSHCDAVLRLDGLSIGADLEVAGARKLRKPVYYSLESVPKINLTRSKK